MKSCPPGGGRAVPNNHFGRVVKEMPNLRQPSNPKMREQTQFPSQLPPGPGILSVQSERCPSSGPC